MSQLSLASMTRTMISQTERIGTIHDGKRTFTITITITVKILYSACSQKVSRGLRRRVYINIEQKVHVLR